MRESLKIIIFDGSFKTTTFINRLALGLAKKHKVFILGFNEEHKIKIPNVTYISLGSNQNYYRLAIVSLKYALKTKKTSVFNVLKKLILRNKKSLQKQNLDFVLNEIKPDIIHLQWLANIPFFEDYIDEGRHKFVLSQRGYHINVRPFVNEANFKYLQKWFPKINGFHSVSKAIKKVSEKVYNSIDKIDRVVYSGLDFSSFNFEKKTKSNNSKLEIVSVGRDHWIKGYTYAIKAMAILKNKNISFHYTIIGVSEKSEELIYFINDNNLEENITLIPHLNQNDVYAVIQKSDLLILPSLEEGIANVCIEAMALGTTVISTNCGGMEELITNNETGFIVPVRNPEAIAKSVLEFKEMDSENMNVIRKKARLQVEKQHNEAKMIADMETLYKKVYEGN